MEKVYYENVKHIFRSEWRNSAESFLHEILWETLESTGLTTYANDKEYTMCYLYAYVLQMLCEEFSNMAYDEYCSYDFEVEDPLTEASIGWLYRNVLSERGYSNLDKYFHTDATEMLRQLIMELRYTVADPLFKQLGEGLLARLFFFSISGCPQENDQVSEETDEIIDVEPEPFATKEAFWKYCQDSDYAVIDEIPGDNAYRVMHWLSCHSCAVDD